MSPGAQKIEALLFTAAEPVAKKDLAKLLAQPLETVEQYLTEIQEAVTDHGLTLVLTDSHAQLATSPRVAEFLSSFAQEEAQKLSKAAAETLAIIAYRGPVSRYDVDVLRGVDSRSMIRQLLRRGVIQQMVKDGSVPLYEVTQEFLRRAGISRREELPQFVQLSNNERLQQFLAEKSSNT